MSIGARIQKMHRDNLRAWDFYRENDIINKNWVKENFLKNKCPGCDTGVRVFSHYCQVCQEAMNCFYFKGILTKK